jgi:hypothetical protein
MNNPALPLTPEGELRPISYISVTPVPLSRCLKYNEQKFNPQKKAVE